jgi:hypothetical protein
MTFESAKAIAFLGKKIKRHSWNNQEEYVIYVGSVFSNLIKFIDCIHFIPYTPDKFDLEALDWEEFQ